MIKVLIVDDHELLRAGLRSRLEREPGIAVVGEADTAERAVLMARRLQPDLIVLDLLLPRKSGDDVIPDLANVAPQARVLVVSSQAAPSSVRRALSAAARYSGSPSRPWSTMTACRTVPSRFTAARTRTFKSFASRAPAGTFQHGINCCMTCWRSASSSLAVSWLPSGALGCEEGGAVAAMRCGAGGASSACAICCFVRFFKSASKAAGSGCFCSRFFSSLSNALGSALGISGRGAWAACCSSGFGFGSGGLAGGGGGA